MAGGRSELRFREGMAQVNLATSLRRAGRIPEAIAAGERAVSTCHALAVGEARRELLGDLARARVEHAHALEVGHRLQDALEALEAATHGCQALVVEGGRSDLMGDAARALFNRGLVLARLGHAELAEASVDQAVALTRGLVEERGWAHLRFRLGNELITASELRAGRGDHAAALACAEEAVAVLSSLVTEGRADQRERLSAALCQRGSCKLALQRPEGLADQREAAELASGTSVEGHAGRLHNLAWALRGRGELSEADEVQSRAHALLEQAVADGREDLVPRLARSWRGRALIADAREAPEEVVRACVAAMELLWPLAREGAVEQVEQLAYLQAQQAAALGELGALTQAIASAETARAYVAWMANRLRASAPAPRTPSAVRSPDGPLLPDIRRPIRTLSCNRHYNISRGGGAYRRCIGGGMNTEGTVRRPASVATFVLCGGAPQGELGRFGPPRRVPAMPAVRDVGASDTPWVVLRLPGEGGDVNDAALVTLVELLPKLPPDVSAVELDLRLPSQSGSRLYTAVRAVRREAFRGHVGVAEPELLVDGRTVKARRLTLEVARSERQDLVARAELMEQRGCPREAIGHWEMLFDLPGGWGGYARMRAALAYAAMRPTGVVVRDHLGAAWAHEPRLAEVPLRLAGWYLAQGSLGPAVAAIEAADVLRSDVPPVPRLEGVESWAVPAFAARWLAPHVPGLAAEYTSRALGRAPPPVATEELVTIAGCGQPPPSSEGLQPAT